jgi:hypothetical protein
MSMFLKIKLKQRKASFFVESIYLVMFTILKSKVWVKELVKTNKSQKVLLMNRYCLIWSFSENFKTL